MIFITLWSQTLVGAAQQTTKVIEEAKPIASSTVETITSADPVVIVGAAGAVFLAYLLFPSIWSAVSFGLRGYKGESAVYLFYRCFIYVKSLVWTRNVKQLNNSFHLHFDAISSSCGSLIVISDFHTWVSSSFHIMGCCFQVRLLQPKSLIYYLQKITLWSTLDQRKTRKRLASHAFPPVLRTRWFRSRELIFLFESIHFHFVIQNT